MAWKVPRGRYGADALIRSGPSSTSSFDTLLTGLDGLGLEPALRVGLKGQRWTRRLEDREIAELEARAERGGHGLGWAAVANALGFAEARWSQCCTSFSLTMHSMGSGRR